MKVTIKAAVSVAILIGVFIFVPLHQLREAVSRVDGGAWLVALLGFLAGHTLGVFKWRMLVNGGRPHLRLLTAARCYAAGLFANLCLPSIVGGDTVRAVLAARETRHPEATVLGGLADRTIDTATVAFLVALGAVLARHALPLWAVRLLAVTIGAGVVAGAAALIVAARMPIRRWPHRLRRPVGRGLVALRRLRRQPGIAVGALALSIVIQISFVALGARLGASMGVTIPFGAWLFAWSLAKLSGLVPISLGGLAVRDATLAALLVPFGVPAAYGVVVSLAWQSVLIAGGLISGVFWWVQRPKVAGAPRATLASALSVRSAA